METEKWSLDQCKDFLHRSWLSTFSRKQATYFPLGNTKATDFLHDFDFQASELDVLMLGAGDIRSLLRTVSGLENKEHSKQRVKKLHVLLNDIDADIVARDVLLLHIIHTMDVNQEEDFHFLWNVWYNLELPEKHCQRLGSIITRMKDGNIAAAKDNVWSFMNKSTEEAVAKSFHQWQACSVTVTQAQRSRMEAMDHIKQDFTFLTETTPDVFRPFLHHKSHREKLIGVMLVKEMMNIQAYNSTIEEFERVHHLLESYYTIGSADPYYGMPGKQWPAGRNGWKVNPTLLKADTTEYLADVTTTPYTSYIPMQKEVYDEHPHLGQACFSILMERVRIYRRLVDSQKLKLHIELCCDDAAVLLTSDALNDRKFDFINTSNLADEMSLLALLLLCQAKLREARSMLCVESILWRHDHDTIEQYMQHELMGLDPLFFPTVLGLRLAESFHYGCREIPTDTQMTNGAKCEHFCFRETLMWMKAGCEDVSPINIAEDNTLHTYLVGLSLRVLSDTSSSHLPQDLFVLFKLLQRIAPGVEGGMERLLHLVEPMVTIESELMFQWQVYLAVYGYAEAQDELMLVEAPVIKEKLPAKFSKPSFLTCSLGGNTPQRFQNVLFSTSASDSRKAEVLMLSSHKNAIKNVLPISLTSGEDDQSEILVENNFTTKYHTDVTASDRETNSTQPTKEMFSIREEAEKYIVSLQKGLLINKAACKIIHHNTLTIITPRSKQEVRLSFLCPIEDVSVTSRDEACQVTVTKKKESISGEHLLPLCRILLNKLKPLEDYLQIHINRLHVTERMIPLASHKKIQELCIGEPVKAMNVIGEGVLVCLRVLLWTLIEADEHFFDLANGSIELELKDACWYNNTILRKLDVFTNLLALPLGQRVNTIPHVNKEALRLLEDLLRYNGQRVDQSGSAPGRYASFVQIHYPRGNIMDQRDREQKQLQGQGADDDDVCASCRKKDNNKQCTACLSVKYCSRECQKLHYRRHKLLCKHLTALKPAAVPKPSLCPNCKIKEADSANLCSRCKKTGYCSMKCRYAHWPEHQRNCQDEKDPSNDAAPTSKKSLDTTSSVTAIKSTTASTPKPSTIKVPTGSTPRPAATQDKLLSSKGPSSSNASASSNPPSSTDHPATTSSTSCAWCHTYINVEESRRECSKCHESVYCSERCENAHWPQHWQRCIELSLANVASCVACKHTLTRCHRCKKVWFCSGCLEHMKQHKC